jgi:hypothetical protein
MSIQMPFELLEQKERKPGDILDIVKPDTQITNQDYFYQKWKKQNVRINNLQEIENKEIIEKYVQESLMNMTILQILQKFSKTMNDILDDILKLIKTPVWRKIGLWIEILTRGDRMIYTGMFIIIVAVLMYFVDIT